VDIAAGDRLVELIEAAMRRTHGPRVLGRHGDFAGMFRLDYNEKLFARNYKEPVLVACTDGVGTKTKLAAELGVYATIGIDCVAMNVNDLIVQGAEPLFFLDYVGLHRTIPQRTAAIIEGVARGCEIAGCALIGGETSEMPDVYAEGDFDLVGFAVGVVPLSRVVDWQRVEEGDVLVGLESSGLHSNGYTLARAIVRKARLQLDRTCPRVGDRTLGEILLTPTRIYSRPIVRLLSRYRVKRVVSGMAHITGGGLPGNVVRLLPEDVDAVIRQGSWPIPPVFAFLQEHGEVAPQEMLRVFNMGIGFVLAVRPAFAASIVRQLERLRERPHVIGHVVKGSRRVRIE
jgi:phosphoribosylformylglycinamidine cyclo-ligase